ncbi:hypothetical protein [Siphonobacter sp. SORGH_AS_1065]|uniref:hypothetical protein n=1 Tax=Siphonobacter sp. SORGH_AS_1065 TaxID=3041795 RepID=UPI0027805F38|nr:hypothetical protein [Siphonobacter sp. SORGH_AS_1065]MDQ1086120.1 hypothetical protein [Siphonobacter sp. SORGH_AS_1065]
MPILTVFYIKVILSIFLTLGVILTIWKPTVIAGWQQKNDTLAFSLGFLLLRLIPWIVIFILFNHDPRGDVPFFYYKAQAAKAGGFVYRDFWSYHAPLFAYIISLPLWIWHNSRSIVLFMVLMETLILWLTYRTYKKEKSNALQATFIYWLIPASFMYILIDGQEEVWFWGLALLMWRHVKKNPVDYEVGLGVIFAIALLTTKATFVFFLPPLLVSVRKPIKMLLVMAAIGLPALAFLYWQIGDRFLMPIQHTEQLMTPNLFSITRPFIELFVHIDQTNSTAVNWIGLIITMLLVSYLAYRGRVNPLSHTLPSLFIATFACMMIFQASAPGAYLIAYVLAVVFEIVDLRNNKHLLILLVLSWLTVVQPFVNVWIKQPDYISFSMLANPAYLGELALQVMNVACFFWIVTKAAIKIVTPNYLRSA